MDIAELLDKEMEEIKDRYNEDRESPPVDWNMPGAPGRIKWVRNLFQKIDDPMKVRLLSNFSIEIVS